MGKKKSLNLLRFLYPFPAKNLSYSFLSQILQALSSYLYFLTLESGEVEYLKDQAGYFACLLFMSLIITIISFIIVYHQLNEPLNYANYFMIVTQLCITITYDLGTDLQNHGQYNLMGYFLMSFPFILAFFFYKTCIAVKGYIRNDKRYSLFSF